MAYRTLSVVAPLAVTAQALAMVGTFESRLSEIIRISFAAVAFLARGNSPGRRKMMAGLAV